MRSYLFENSFVILESEIEEIEKELKQGKIKQTNSFLTSAIQNGKYLQAQSSKIGLKAPLKPFINFFQYMVKVRALAIARMRGDNVSFSNFEEVKSYLTQLELTKKQKILAGIIMVGLDALFGALLTESLRPIFRGLSSISTTCIGRYIIQNIPDSVAGFTEEASKYVGVKAKFITQYEIIFNLVEFSGYVAILMPYTSASLSILQKVAAKFKLNQSDVQFMSKTIRDIFSQDFIQQTLKGAESFGLKAHLNTANIASMNLSIDRSPNPALSLTTVLSARVAAVLFHLFAGILHKLNLTPVAVITHILWNIFVSSVFGCYLLKKMKLQ